MTFRSRGDYADPSILLMERLYLCHLKDVEQNCRSGTSKIRGWQVSYKEMVTRLGISIQDSEEGQENTGVAWGGAVP